MLRIILIALSGAAGSLCRYGAVSLLALGPWGTFAVNVAGALLAGFLCRRLPADLYWRPMVFAGFLGAFTTFSTFALECGGMLEAGQYGRAALYLGATNLCGLAAVFLGFWLAGRLGA